MLAICHKGSEKWPQAGNGALPDQFLYSPVCYPYIEEPVSKYLGKRWMHHQYVNWALLNAFLLDYGRRQIMLFDEDWRSKAADQTMFRELKDVTFGPFLEHMEEDSDFSKLISIMRWKVRKVRLIEIGITAIIATLAWILNFHKISLTIMLLYLVAVFCIKDKTKELYTRKYFTLIKSKLILLEDAWQTANSPAVDLIRLKEKIGLVEEQGLRYSPVFHALMRSTIDEYGNTISVTEWL